MNTNLDRKQITYGTVDINSTLSMQCHELANYEKYIPCIILFSCYQVWGNACDTHIKAIQILQNRVVRLITYNDFPLIPGPLPASNPVFCNLNY